jgi:hypothetical protein
MNRGGQDVASPHLDENRLEYFDPKTRPAALIWDHEAIMGTPFRMMQGFRHERIRRFGSGRRAKERESVG